MDNFKLRSLAREIVSKRKIGRTNARKIESLLSSADLLTLAEYIRIEQDKQTVRLTVADIPSKKMTDSISDMFGGKRIITTVDTKIGAGVKAQVYDMIYDLTVKSKLNNLVERLGEEI